MEASEQNRDQDGHLTGTADGNFVLSGADDIPRRVVRESLIKVLVKGGRGAGGSNGQSARQQ